MASAELSITPPFYAELEAKWAKNSSNPDFSTRLPVEILLLIFCFVRKAARVKLRTPDVHKDVFLDMQRLVPTSHVCRRWRSVALASPNLWSSIELVDGKCRWAIEMLKRSKGTRLNIFIDYKIFDSDFSFTPKTRTPSSVAKLALSQTKEHFERWQELVIINSSYETLTSWFCTDFAGCSMSNLHSLTIYFDINACDPVTLSDEEIRADSLRELSITNNVELDWNASFMRGLTCLKLHSSHMPSEFTQLLDHLCNLPALVEFDVDLKSYVPQSMIVIENHPIQKKKLPLTHFSATSVSFFPIIALLSVIAVHSVHLNLIVEPWHFEMGDLLNFYSSINRHISSSNGSPTPVRRYTFTQRSPFELCVIGGSVFNEQTVNKDDASTTILCLRLIFSPGHGSAHEPPSLLVPTCQHLVGKSVSGLKFEAIAPFSTENWRIIYGRLPKLQSIHIKEPNILTFFVALVQDTFPALDTISCEISNAIDHTNNQELEASLPHQYLQLRKDRGSALKSLSFIGITSLSDECEGRLRAVVGRLQFIPNSK